MAVPSAPRVAVEQADAIDRHVDQAAVVFQVQEVLHDAAHLQLLQAPVAADAVIVVNDRVALRDLAQVAQRGRLGGADFACLVLAEDLVLGDQHQPIARQAEAMTERTGQHRHPAPPRCCRRAAPSSPKSGKRRLGIAQHLRRQAPRIQQARKPIGVGAVRSHDAHALAVGRPAVDAFHQGGAQVAIGLARRCDRPGRAAAPHARWRSTRPASEYAAGGPSVPAAPTPMVDVDLDGVKLDAPALLQRLV